MKHFKENLLCKSTIGLQGQNGEGDPGSGTAVEVWGCIDLVKSEEEQAVSRQNYELRMQKRISPNLFACQKPSVTWQIRNMRVIRINEICLACLHH